VCERWLASLSQKVHDALLGGELPSPKLADPGTSITNVDVTKAFHSQAKFHELQCITKIWVKLALKAMKFTMSYSYEYT
jgi:hypothetical protein